MVRLVLVKADGPLEIKPQRNSVWICECGLSHNKPYCDGSHVQTRNEQDGTIYLYDELTQRQAASVFGVENLIELVKRKK